MLVKKRTVHIIFPILVRSDEMKWQSYVVHWACTIHDLLRIEYHVTYWAWNSLEALSSCEQAVISMCKVKKVRIC